MSAVSVSVSVTEPCASWALSPVVATLTRTVALSARKVAVPENGVTPKSPVAVTS